MKIKPFTLMIALPVLGVIIASGNVVMAFSHMPTAQDIVGLQDTYEVAEVNTVSSADIKADAQQVAMLETDREG